MFEKLFSRHMKIERMIISCGLMVTILMSVLIYDGISIYKASQVTLSDAPILSGSSVTSLTNTPFSIKNIYRSEDKTQAMIILEGDLSQVSYIADTYRVYLLGPSAEEYSGGIYVFEDLDAICIYVTDVNTFEVERTQLVIKSSASTADGNGANKTDDMSFYINLGAANAQTVSFMDDSGLNITKMAESAFSHDDDETIRTSLLEAQNEMVNSRNVLSNIRQSIDRKEIQLPAVPEWMIYSDENGNDKPDEVAIRENTNSNYIKTSYIFSGCADFDWENTTRLNNYAEVSGIPIESLSVSIDEDNSVSNTQELPNIDDYIPTEWYHSDGSVISNPTTSESSLISQYETAIKNYYDAKLNYQELVASLIMNQNKYLKAIENYTSNVGSEVFTGVKYKN